MADGEVANELSGRLLMPNALCRRPSSSSSSCESGFQSDMSDEANVSPIVVGDEAVQALNGHVCCESVAEKDLESVKRISCRLVSDVVASMVPEYSPALPRPSNCRYSATLLRVVHELSGKHEIVFESITRKLQPQINGHRDTEVCRRTFVGVVDHLFADGRYNWGRVVTVFAYAGWLARINRCTGSETDVVEWANVVTDVAGKYIGMKLALWICQQGGWDAMETFFAEPVSFETKLWRGLLCTFFGLGVLATMAAVAR